MAGVVPLARKGAAMSRSLSICPVCGTDVFDDIPCSNSCDDAAPVAYGLSGELIDTSAMGYAMTAWRDPINDPPPLNAPVLAIASEYLGDRFNAGGGYLIAVLVMTNNDTLFAETKWADTHGFLIGDMVDAWMPLPDKPKDTTT
jgi:hypothetical protein